MTVNQETLDLIKRWEGFKAKAYLDTIASPAVWTIGYGTTAGADVGIKPRAGMVITEAEAEDYLRKTIDKFARTLRPHITKPINDNEFGAFISLAYNIGPTAFKNSSALRLFNEGKKQEAANAILLWNKAGNPKRTVEGLVNRRRAERDLFLKPVSVANTSNRFSILDWFLNLFKNP